MNRRWIGVDINPRFIDMVADRIAASNEWPIIETGFPGWPGDDEVRAMIGRPPKKRAKDKTTKAARRKTFGRSVGEVGAADSNAKPEAISRGEYRISGLLSLGLVNVFVHVGQGRINRMKRSLRRRKSCAESIGGTIRPS